MNAPAATGAEIYLECVDRIRGSDIVTPVETLRAETFSLLGELPGVTTTQDVDTSLPALRAALSRPLGAALALLDHGGERGPTEVAWMLQTLADRLGQELPDPSTPMLALALRELAYSLLADCLSRGRLEPLPRIAAVAIPARFDDAPWPIFEASDLRHPDVFERHADRAYAEWSQWLASSELVGVLTHVRGNESIAPVIAEGELVGALAFARRHGESFCAVIGAGGSAERALRAHRREPQRALALASFLGVPESDLDVTLNDLYSRLRGEGPFRRSRGP